MSENSSSSSHHVEVPAMVREGNVEAITTANDGPTLFLSYRTSYLCPRLKSLLHS